MPISDQDLAHLADRLRHPTTEAQVEHRVRVDAGDLAIVDVPGDYIDTHLLIVTAPATGQLVSLADYAFPNDHCDVAYDTRATIHGVPYVYSMETGGRIDNDGEGPAAEAAATVVFEMTGHNAEATHDR